MKNSINDCILSLKFFILETVQNLMKCRLSLNAAFHLGPHCLPKYLFTGIQNEKG